MSQDEDVVTSLTKGCFLFKPRDAPIPKKRRKKEKQDYQELSSEDFFFKFKEESKQNHSDRYITFQNCWNDLEVQIESVQHELNEKLFDDLLVFVSNSYSRQHLQFPVAEIPTAALFTGVNLPDHNLVFSRFVSKLQRLLTPHVAQLQSKDCTNLRSMLKSAFEAIVNSSAEEEKNESDEETGEDSDLNQSLQKNPKSKIFKDYTFIELLEWYKEKCQLSVSGIMNNDKSMDIVVETSQDSPQADFIGSRPLVFILEDFERFSPTVLQDFILICSEYVPSLPIILLFGVATTLSAVHRSLPHFVSSRLCIEKFQALPSLVCLTEVVDKVLITDTNAFKLGPKVFRLLYEHFLYHDFSINNFIRALKFSVMEHFYGNVFSIMCTTENEIIEDYVLAMDAKKLESIKELESFASYLDKKSESEQKKLENDKQYMKETILQLITELQLQEQVFYPNVKCIHIVASKLPGHPMGKRLRDTYEYCTISPDITKDKQYNNAISLTRFLSRDELLPILQNCQNILQAAILDNKNCHTFQQHVDAFQTFTKRFEELENLTAVYEDEKATKEPVKPTKVFKNRYEFQEKLKKAVKEKKKESPYEKLRNDIMDEFDCMFKKFLRSPLSMPFHEIFYFNDMQLVKQRINGTPRGAIQKALSNPNFYLQCTCCPPEKGDIQPTMPDVCILYKLHLEGGKLINLYDWLQAFITVIDPSLSDTSKKKSQKKKKLEEQLQARFIRGVSELQFLGFIKATKRKTDHVARLTWGGC